MARKVPATMFLTVLSFIFSSSKAGRRQVADVKAGNLSAAEPML
jgi:hypothetical protein